jgi:hypothetical protein
MTFPNTGLDEGRLRAEEVEAPGVVLDRGRLDASKIGFACVLLDRRGTHHGSGPGGSVSHHPHGQARFCNR